MMHPQEAARQIATPVMGRALYDDADHFDGFDAERFAVTAETAANFIAAQGQPDSRWLDAESGLKVLMWDAKRGGRAKGLTVVDTGEYRVVRVG